MDPQIYPNALHPVLLLYATCFAWRTHQLQGDRRMFWLAVAISVETVARFLSVYISMTGYPFGVRPSREVVATAGILAHVAVVLTLIGWVRLAFRPRPGARVSTPPPLP